ncbi:MAG TPA: undecaprenyldiphospho-muramoylpentapeptide beta-N-acetylglucosaminyltransferase [Candidatus Obscuribacterales bacterium]
MVQHRIVLTGGGTGGHIYPALAVAEQLVEDPEVESLLYIGARGQPEEKLARDRKLEFVGLTVSGLPRKISWKLLGWPGEMLSAISQAKKVLRLFRPTVVLGTGGYASAPPLGAASSLSIPYAIHEPDAHPGLVNRVFARRAQLVSLGMEAAADRLKTSRGRIVVNGNPVRKSFVRLLNRDAACAVLGLDMSLKTVLITGGSQGARAVNEALIPALPSLLESEPPVQIIHQAGERNVQDVKERLDRSILQHPRYLLRGYFEDLSIAYAVCDLAVCRAGAMTVAELAVTGTPALFIPYPYAAADHQTHNARFVASKDAAAVLPQSSLTPQSLRDQVLGLLADDERLKQMRKQMQSLGKPQAANDLANQVKEVSAAYQARARAVVV